MGCSDTGENTRRKTQSLEISLENQKNQLEQQIYQNNEEKYNLEKKIEDYDKKIKEGENYIKMNQSQLSEEQLRSTARKIIEIKRDRTRDQRTLEQISTMNEGLKNNLDATEKKIIEIKNMKALKNQNEIMKQYEKENIGQTAINNAEFLKKQRDDDNKIQRLLQRGNDAYIGNDDLKDEDAYLKNLLGNGTSGNPF